VLEEHTNIATLRIIKQSRGMVMNATIRKENDSVYFSAS